MKIWEWLGESKNQQILIFLGGALAGAVAIIVPLLFQFGVFEPKPVPAKTPPAGVTAAPAPDVAMKTLVDILIQKEKADAEKARLAYKQELQAWDFAQKLHTARGYQAYLSDYPKGEFSSLANAALDKFRNSVVVVAEMPAISIPPEENVRAKPVPVKKPPAKPTVKPNGTRDMARLIVNCVEGTKLYIDGVEKGQINSALFGSLSVELSAGKHGLILVSPQGVLQQKIELIAKESRRINPPFCN